jgi:AraC-like DNA-binding protein
VRDTHRTRRPANTVKSRQVTWAEPGLLRVRQRVAVRRGEMGTDATGPYWVFAVVRVQEGGLQYLHGAGRVAAPGRRFAIFMPRWSIVCPAPSSCVVATDAVTSHDALTPEMPVRPVAWRWPGGDPPATRQGVERAVAAAGPFVVISRDADPSATARHAKTVLDQSYDRPLTLARIATLAGLSPSVLSRSFRRAYGMPPVEYRHRLRVMDAMFRLASGGEILSVLEDVGFGDVSRFYSRFRTLLCAPPGAYRDRSRNAKT